MLYIMEETVEPGWLEAFSARLSCTEQEFLRKRKNEKAYSQGLLARVLLLYAIKQEYGLEYLPAMERETRGKPYFPDFPQFHFNLSHSDKGIACALSDQEVGVDIQPVILWKEKVGRWISHEKEWDCLNKSEERDALLTDFWSLKEAYLKFTGEGIRRSLGELNFSAAFTQREFFLEGIWFQVFRGKGYSGAVCGPKPLGKPIKVQIKDVKAVF